MVKKLHVRRVRSTGGVHQSGKGQREKKKEATRRVCVLRTVASVSALVLMHARDK